MNIRLLSHLTKYNILILEQYGFKKNLTTENATYIHTYISFRKTQ